MLVAARSTLETHFAAESTHLRLALTRGATLLIGWLIAAVMLAERVMYDSSVLCVQREPGAIQQRAAMAFVSSAAATVVTRFAGDRALVVGGALLSALVMSIVRLSVRAGLTTVFFTVVGIDAETIVPILCNASRRVRSITRAGAIVSVCSIGGFGFMIGPPVIVGIARRPGRRSP